MAMAMVFCAKIARPVQRCLAPNVKKIAIRNAALQTVFTRANDRNAAFTVRPCLRMDAPNKPQICLQQGTRCDCNMEYGGTPGSVRRCMTLHSGSPRVFSVVRGLKLLLPCILKVLLS
jgi:hypothetical protein